MLKRNSDGAPPFGDIAADDDKDIEVQQPEESARKHLRAEARMLLRDIVFALLVATLTVVFVVQPVKVKGISMLPRLHDGERIFVNKLIYYGLPRLERGDIVVFWFPDDPSESYIKRIVGLPGETVEVREGRIYINGQRLEEPYLDPQLNLSRINQQPVLVKNHYYFVMGDNRDHSSDSRYWGLVPEKYIYGKALFRYWPLTQASLISHDVEYRLEPSPQAFDKDSAGERSRVGNEQ
jgi:signal peptidase I